MRYFMSIFTIAIVLAACADAKTCKMQITALHQAKEVCQ